MESFPVYLLKLGGETGGVFPDDRRDIGHTEFWENTVSHIVATFFKIPQNAAKFAILPAAGQNRREHRLLRGGVRSSPPGVDLPSRGR